MKRGMFGTYHSVAKPHLSRYLAEWDFQMEHPQGSTMGNVRRFYAKGIEGKRLTYRPTN